MEERWGSWEKMMNINTDQVTEEYKEFVKECYEEPFQEIQGQKDELWKDIMREITLQELNQQGASHWPC